MENLPICRRIDGNLVLVQENLNKIIETDKFDPNLPIALISFIGEKGSGKTIYTNLLIQNLRHNSTGGWLDKVDANTTKKNQLTPLPGFQNSTNEDTQYSEVCLWPEIFYLQSRGKPLMVLILHTHYVESDPRSNDVDSLELFLSMVCSKIVEIHWKSDEFRFLAINRDLKEFDDNYGDRVCNNVVYFFRRNTKSKQLEAANGTNISHSNLLKNMMSAEIKSVVNDLESFFVTLVPDQVKNIQSSKGYLKLELATYDAIYSSINLLADDEHVFPKTISNKQNFLLGESFIEHIRVCSEISNTLIKQDSECSIFKQLPKRKTSESLPKNCSINESIIKEASSKTKETKYQRDAFTSGKQQNFSHFSESDSFKTYTGDSSKRTVKENLNEERNHSDVILSTLELVVKTAATKVSDILGEWNMTDINFRCLDVLEQCLHNSRLKHGEQVEKLTESERVWVFDSALKQLTDDHAELNKVETILGSLNSILCNAQTDAKALYLLLKMYNLEKEMTGNNVFQTKDYKKFVLNICNNSVLKYINSNRSTDIFLRSLEQMRSFYIEEMKRYLEMGPYSRKSLDGIHNLLLRRCSKSVIDVMSWFLDCDLTESQSQLNRICKQRLQANFVDFQKTNTKVLSMVYKRLSSLIAKSKVYYDEKIVQVVNSRASFENLKVAHIQGTDDAIQFLKDRIQQVRPLEPVACHQQTLQALIDSDWILLSEGYSP